MTHPGAAAPLVLLSLSSILSVTSSSRPPSSSELDASYTFSQYVADFNKAYQPEKSEEWMKRDVIFQRNLRQILNHNAKYYNAESNPHGRGHTLGVNHFMDLDTSEMVFGYDKGGHKAWRGRGDDDGEVSVARRLGVADESSSHEMDLPFAIDDVSTLPKSVDWRTKKNNVITPVKDQGGCGSCWAFATIATLESHIAIETGTLFSLSPQELVSCVPNPRECGGAGGCAGSTAELALDYVATDGHGILEEWQMGYTSYHGHVEECAIEDDGKMEKRDNSFLLRGSDGRPHLGGGIRGAVATIDGYAVVPTNNYTVLMNAVAKTGPIAVAAAASPWRFYEKGVFSDDDVSSDDPSKYDVNHLVQLVGYGTDEETGEDYWLIRNSWRPTWGEDGYIRLKRVDPSTLSDPESVCGMDVTPSDGISCQKDENMNPITPPAVKVCGTSGVLFNGVLPIGGRKL